MDARWFCTVFQQSKYLSLVVLMLILFSACSGGGSVFHLTLLGIPNTETTLKQLARFIPL